MTGPEPGSLAYFAERQPEVAQSLEDLIAVLYKENALDGRTRELVFLGIQAALRLPRAIRVHVPRAISAGATPDEIIAAITLVVPNAGMNAATEAVGIAAEVLQDLAES